MSLFTDDFQTGDLFAQFGEQVAYRCAAGGSPRSIEAVVSRRQSASMDDDETTLSETLSVAVAKSDLPADEIRLGDSIDWQGNTYTFSGEIEDESDALWTLIFERRRPWQVGGRQVQD